MINESQAMNIIAHQLKASSSNPIDIVRAVVSQTKQIETLESNLKDTTELKNQVTENNTKIITASKNSSHKIKQYIDMVRCNAINKPQNELLDDIEGLCNGLSLVELVQKKAG